MEISFALVIKVYFVLSIIFLFIRAIIGLTKDYMKDKRITESSLNKKVLSIWGLELNEYGIYSVSECLPNFVGWGMVRIDNHCTDEYFFISLYEIEMSEKSIKDEYWT